MLRLLPFVLLVACLPTLEDNSLEAPMLEGAGGEGTLQGALSVTDQGGGDWSIAVGADAVTLHSASRADLSGLDGVEGTVDYYSEIGLPTVVITDADGVRFVTGGDGSAAFGEAKWRHGEVIGRGEVVDEFNEPNDVRFTEVIVSGDDGDVVLLPGEPASIVIDDATYRVTVVAAYEAEDRPGMKCGMSDVIAVEAVRTDEDPGEPLLREKGLLAPSEGCG